LHAAHHPSINATIKLVKEGSFPSLWVLAFHAWMLTSKTTSSQIFSQRRSLHDSHALFSESIITCSFLSCNLLCIVGGPGREKKLQGQTLTCSLVFVCAAIQELGIQPYNEDLHLGELRYVQVRFYSFLGKFCLVSSFGTPDHKHGPNGPEGM
jgi:hypothetical protein